MTPDKERDNIGRVREALEYYAKFFGVDPACYDAIQGLKALTALEAELKALRECVRDLEDIVTTTRTVSALRAWAYREEILNKHAATISSVRGE